MREVEAAAFAKLLHVRFAGCGGGGCRGATVVMHHLRGILLLQLMHIEHPCMLWLLLLLWVLLHHLHLHRRRRWRSRVGFGHHILDGVNQRGEGIIAGHVRRRHGGQGGGGRQGSSSGSGGQVAMQKCTRGREGLRLEMRRLILLQDDRLLLLHSSRLERPSLLVHQHLLLLFHLRLDVDLLLLQVLQVLLLLHQQQLLRVLSDLLVERDQFDLHRVGGLGAAGDRGGAAGRSQDGQNQRARRCRRGFTGSDGLLVLLECRGGQQALRTRGRRSRVRLVRIDLVRRLRIGKRCVIIGGATRWRAVCSLSLLRPWARLLLVALLRPLTSCQCSVLR